MTPDLETVLADAYAEAQALRSGGHASQADHIERLMDAVKEAAHDYLVWLNETEAQLHAARSRAWLRTRFPDWERAGHARRRPDGAREYRLIVLPRRADIAGARAAGKRAAQEDRPAA